MFTYSAAPDEGQPFLWLEQKILSEARTYFPILLSPVFAAA